MIARVQQDFGRLDILVNNVGIQYVAPVHEVGHHPLPLLLSEKPPSSALPASLALHAKCSRMHGWSSAA
jgi:NAD(P)-dependent dehydrogenase (short-subunit alcohol dehydrogenase family)